MKSIRYVGPAHAVDVEIAPRKYVTVANGETVEVGDALAESLLEQVDTWATVAQSKKAASKETQS